MTAKNSRQAYASYNRKSGQITLVFSKEGRELALEAMKKVFGDGQGQILHDLIVQQLSGA